MDKQTMATNPEIDQDRVFDTTDHFNRFGYVMFPQQVEIYQNIAKTIHTYDFLLDAGCGNGVGTALLDRRDNRTGRGLVTGADKLERNTDFARCLYPWLAFMVWDINQAKIFNPQADIVVCVETIEHVEYPRQAIQNLIAAAREEVWISTPNGLNKKRPPNNKYHVCEYTPEEMLNMIGRAAEILHWKDLSLLPLTTKVNPLVYRIKL